MINLIDLLIMGWYLFWAVSIVWVVIHGIKLTIGGVQYYLESR